MRWELVAGRLASFFRKERLRTSDGRVLVPRGGRPVNLHALLLEGVEEKDDEDEDWHSVTGSRLKVGLT